LQESRTNRSSLCLTAAPQFLDDSSFSVCDFALQYKYSSVGAIQYQCVCQIFFV